MQNETTEDKESNAVSGRDEPVVMCGVTEYTEGMDVCLKLTDGKYKYGVNLSEREGFGREVIRAKNEGGHNITEVDLEQLLEWVAANKPDKYMEYVTSDMMINYT